MTSIIQKSMFLLLFLSFPSLNAATITIHEDSTASVDIDFKQNGDVIEINQVWLSNGVLFLLVSGITPNVSYKFVNNFKNTTGISWKNISFELLDSSGDTNDDDYDVCGIPDWVPSSFSTSNNKDGLSFVNTDIKGSFDQNSLIFKKVIVDTQTQARDYIDFYDGIVPGNEGTDTIFFGIKDKYDIQPFILAIRANEFSECNNFDLDKDGVIDIWDNCPNTPQNSYVDKTGCHISGTYTEDDMKKMINSILNWGDTDQDGKIGLSEAVTALLINTEILKCGALKPEECLNEDDCNKYGKWKNNSCHRIQPCSEERFEFCFTQESCERFGGFWCDNTECVYSDRECEFTKR